MEKKLTMTIEPLPKERPRATVVGGHARIYTPKTTASYEKKIRDAWVKANGDKPQEGPLVARIHFGLPVPRSETKARKRLMLTRQAFPTKKPDLDNLCKAVMDGLNGVAYKDDNQIVTLLTRKFYAEVPYIRIIIHEQEALKEDGT